MATRRKNTNRRKPSPGGRKPLITLLVVILLIAGIFFLLERVKSRTPLQIPAVPPAAMERQKIPSRSAETPVILREYTSVVIPPAPKKKPLPRVAGPGTVAIVIDDMGSSMEEARQLLAINLPLTFSIIPGLAKSRSVAEEVHAKGRQVMLHIPMEPKGFPQRKLEKNGLLLSESSADIERQMAEYLQTVPHAVGANNHMGSSFTENGEKMEVVLKVLQGKGLYFIDSKTSSASVGYSLAKKMGMRAASRQVFLDNTLDVAAITSQLDQVAALARKRGSAIAICHPHRQTIQALAAAMPRMQREGIRFVAASELVN
ncbi:divergent polysaccharide deacetylase family protein [Geomobilimonas luticola]|uniref:Divergent polysaccharide deacetylase family protein n=1 Tax=Geomobilimonas luticola TaxID=1114878 RepID=A0ABS5SF41_9BACT|nr:divergent polysaccharide deacetylase family protein [Geomobilimonas luticola]MBT0653968.1 divergent polysaccharide deacetylase family protein [Geomobilimonas luticola]